MRIAFLHSDKPRERILADAFLLGAAAHGHETMAAPLGSSAADADCDVAVMVGVKSRENFQKHLRSGRHVVYLDKGYSRHKRQGGRTWEFWRVAIDSHQPTAKLARMPAADHGRMQAAGWVPAPWRVSGAQVVFAGSSEKYHAFYGLPHPSRYARTIIREIYRIAPDRKIFYRPKPSWHAAEPVKRAVYSQLPETLSDILDGAWALVTHGSNACFDAIMAGVPAIVLGEGVAKPISSTSLEKLADPRIADDADRMQWLANLAWWQWTEAEMASGEAWQFLGKMIHA